MSLLWLLTSPNDKSAALAVARSALVGMNDSDVIEHLSNNDGNQLRGLINSAPTKEIGSLISRFEDLASKGKIRDAIETAIDYSDLLYSYPREGDRQDVENWLSLYDRISGRVGGDAALVYRRLTELSNLDDKDAPKSSSFNTWFKRARSASCSGIRRIRYRNSRYYLFIIRQCSSYP
jgi:hypothetical protein